MVFKVLRRGRVISSKGIIDDGYVVVKDGVIVDVGREPVDLASSSGVDVVDLEGALVVPGFIDTHTHGIGGIDFTSHDPYRVLDAARRYIEYGVTSFIVSLVTSPLDVVVKVCKAVREINEHYWTPSHGSRILGVHLEGPYISPEYAGAQNPRYMRRPDVRELARIIELCGDGVILQLTIAPELQGSMDVIRYAVSKGLVVSIGHTNASYEETLNAIKAGASKATHIFNAMRRFHHRDPGPAIALLQSPSVYLEVIADFIHLHPSVVKLVVDYAGPSRVVLVTDSIAAAGMPDGVYELGELKVRVVDGVAKLYDSDVLAGSTLTMDKAFRNILSLGYDLVDVVIMASGTPARSIGLKRVGDIKEGFKADLVVLDDSFNVKQVYVNGVLSYEK